MRHTEFIAVEEFLGLLINPVVQHCAAFVDFFKAFLHEFILINNATLGNIIYVQLGFCAGSRFSSGFFVYIGHEKPLRQPSGK